MKDLILKCFTGNNIIDVNLNNISSNHKSYIIEDETLIEKLVDGTQIKIGKIIDTKVV